jgi:hypothetical protein
MNPEEQRIAIAEACGYKGVTTGVTEGAIKVITGFKNHNFDEEIPDYLNDLNAVHEAEKVMSDKNLYRKFIYLVVLDDPQNTTNEPAWATAAQRAEAFLRTIGKWVSE